MTTNLTENRGVWPSTDQYTAAHGAKLHPGRTAGDGGVSASSTSPELTPGCATTTGTSSGHR